MTSLAERVRLVRDSLFNMGPPIASAVMGLLTVSLQLNYLPAESYGLWISMHAIIATASIVDFGIGWTLTYVVGSDADLRSDETKRMLHGGAAFVTALALVGGVAVFSAALATASALDLSPDLAEAVPVLALAAAAIFSANRISLYVLSVLYGIRAFGLAGLLAAGQTIAIGAGTIFFAVTEKAVAPIATWHCVIAIAFMALGIGALAIIHPGLAFKARLSALPKIFATSRFSLSSQIADLAMIALWEGATLLLTFLAGPAAVVPFHVGMRIPKTLGVIVTRAAEVMMPIGSAGRTQPNLRADRQIVLEGVRWNLVIAVPTCLLLMATAPLVLQVWLGDVDLIVLGVMCLGLSFILLETLGLGTLYFLWGRGDMTTVLLASIGRAAAAWVLMLVAVPYFGVIGATASLVLGTFGTSLWLTSKIPAAPPKPRNGLAAITGGFAVPAILAGIAAFGVSQIGAGPPVVMLVAAIVIGASLFAGTFFVFGAWTQERDLAAALLAKLALPFSPRLKIVRRRLRGYRFLRSMYHGVVEVLVRLRGEWRSDSAKVENLFADQSDPWQYSSRQHQLRLDRAEKLIDAAFDSFGTSPNTRVLEIGCAEGFLTERLARRPLELTSIDLSPTALTRSRARVGETAPVRFLQLDICTDPLPAGPFDLIIADGILDYFRSRKVLRKLAQSIKAQIRPGGFVLLGNTRQHDIIEGAWWARWLARGGVNVNNFVAREMGATRIREDSDGFYTYLLVQREA